MTRGSHLYVTCWRICDWDQDFWLCLMAWSSLLKLFTAWLLWVKGRIWAARSWSFHFRSLEVILIPWSALKKGFDRLIQFWSLSQTLLHGTYKWLPLVMMMGGQLVSECQLPLKLPIIHIWWPDIMNGMNGEHKRVAETPQPLGNVSLQNGLTDTTCYSHLELFPRF